MACNPKPFTPPVERPPRPRREPETRLGRWFPARFTGGECPECGEKHHEGDQIRADGNGTFLCGNCGEDAEENP
jgi:transcription elongation factor Elf1